MDSNPKDRFIATRGTFSRQDRLDCMGRLLGPGRDAKDGWCRMVGGLMVAPGVPLARRKRASTCGLGRDLGRKGIRIALPLGSPSKRHVSSGLCDFRPKRG